MVYFLGGGVALLVCRPWQLTLWISVGEISARDRTFKIT